MKKVYKVLFVLLLLFFMNAIVKADYECYFDFTHEENGWSGGTKADSGYVKVNTSKKEFEFPLVYFGTNDKIKVLDPYINSEWTEERLIDELDGKCPTKIYVCKGNAGPHGREEYFAIVNHTLKAEFIEKIKGGKAITVGNLGHYFFNQDTPCSTANIDKSKTKVRTKSFSWICEKYNKLKALMDENYCDISDSNCNLEKIQNYKKYKDQIKSYCNIVVQNSDEFEGCMQSCLNLQDEIFELEGTSSNENTCGFSDRLINWIINIMNWIKYILPVIVIILGIIDFIKAMATEKDDEMKKAQKKFVIRLISAALVFIIPFIIVFILEKMGFSAESCGLF